MTVPFSWTQPYLDETIDDNPSIKGIQRDKQETQEAQAVKNLTDQSM